VISIFPWKIEKEHMENIMLRLGRPKEITTNYGCVMWRCGAMR
jgi:hypothetical protein